MRSDGLNQYTNLDGDFAALAADPWIENALVRDPITRKVDAVIVGAGIGALLMAVNLRKIGLDRITMIDKAGDVGGTWYWNRYPGAQCDTESYVYLPLLEETGYIPSEKYAHQPEILEHCQRIANHFDLYDGCLFQTSATTARWLEEQRRWEVHTDRGDIISATYVVISPGRLQSPKLPRIPGAKRFAGEAWHTGRWNPKYSDDRLTDLGDKRIGIIGTGATGLQVVPKLAAVADKVYVFQRTPSAVWVRGNRPTPDDFTANLQPGWQKRRMWNFTAASAGLPTPEGEPDNVADGWTQLANWLADPSESLEVNDLNVMERIRSRIDSLVADPAVAAALKPYYRYGCKRPTFHDEFLPTFNRENVELIDTSGLGPDEISENAVVVSGVSYEVDCLVYASGFDLGRGFLHGTGLDVVGREGKSLSAKWSNGFKTFHGLYSHGFPNCFYIGFTQTAFSVSYTHMAVEQVEHAAHVIAEAERLRACFEPTQAAEEDYVATVRSGRTSELRDIQRSCTPSSINSEGNPDDPNTLGAGQFLPGGNAFFQLLRDWRAEGSFAGLSFC